MVFPTATAWQGRGRVGKSWEGLGSCGAAVAGASGVAGGIGGGPQPHKQQRDTAWPRASLLEP